MEWRESDSDDDSDSSGSGSSSDSGGGGGSESDSVQEEREQEMGVDHCNIDSAVTKTSDTTPAAVVEELVPDLRKQATAFMGVAKNQDRSPEELQSAPLPGETLRTFYDRTRSFWAQKAHEHSENRGKSLRRDGFQLADERYKAYKPILEEIEKIHAEAGLDENDGAREGPAKAAGLGLDSRNRR